MKMVNINARNVVKIVNNALIVPKNANFAKMDTVLLLAKMEFQVRIAKNAKLAAKSAMIMHKYAENA